MSSADISYGERLHQLAVAELGGTAIVFAAEDGSETEHSWSEIDDRSSQLARALAGSGVKEGSRVVIAVRNSPEFIIATFASWKLGATAIPMRRDLPDWESRRVLAAANPSFVIGVEGLGSPGRDVDDLFSQAAKEDPRPFPFLIPQAASGICSSGTTGTPKVILRTTPGVWQPDSRTTSIAESFGLVDTQAQRTIVCGPMYHTNGFTALGDLLSGYSTVIMQRFQAARAVELVERHRPTGMVANTTLLQRIAQEPDIRSRDFSSLQWVLQGGSVLPAWVAETWFDLIEARRFLLIYGSTESAGVVGMAGDDFLKHPGSVGRGLYGTEVRILDDHARELPRGEVGHIYTRPSGGVFVHTYLGGGPQTPVTADGFTTVGDLGSLDSDGYLYIADRRVDMIKSGGVNIFPAEVEVALSEHPGIHDVVVIGLSDPEWGKRVHAVVEARDPSAPPTEAELIVFAKARLAPYKAPKSIEFVDQLPRTEAGKVNRRAMTQQREPST